MPFARIRPLLASTGVRIAALQSLMMAAAMVAAATAAWVATRDLAAQDLRARIGVEVEAVRQEAGREGLPAAAAAVLARAERPGALEYRLVDNHGKVLAGDLPGGRLTPGWSEIDDSNPETDGSRHQRLLVLTSALPGGALLTVGDDVARGEPIRNAIFRAIALWGLVALAAGLTASIWLTRRSLRRMDDVVRTLAAAGHGDLSARTATRAGIGGIGGGGGNIGFDAIGGDDIERLARGVNDMLDRIGQLVAALRRVSADVAHELRTPLAHVRQRLDRVATAPDAATRATALAAANADLDTALRLFDAMLRLAEIDAGLARARFADVDIAEVAERVADAYRPDIEASGRHLMVGGAHTAIVYGDADLIAQALANLIENAMKFSHAAARIEIAVIGGGGMTELRVRDDGPGIAAASLAVITQPFRREAATGRQPGTGLGLAIVAAVARLHGAPLLVEDAAPGLCVRMQFPAR